MQLRKSEQIAIQGLVKKLEEVQQRYVEPINKDLQVVLRDIEDRLELPENALSTTHSLDYMSGVVKELEHGKNDTPNESEASSR
jgi:hypothetical protein